MPTYRADYQGSTIELRHNIREGTYALSISNPDHERRLSFKSTNPRDVSDIQCSPEDYRYFKAKREIIKSIVPLIGLKDNEKIAVLSALERII